MHMQLRKSILGMALVIVLAACSKRQTVEVELHRIEVDPAFASAASEVLQNWYRGRGFHQDVDVDGTEAQLCWVAYPKSPPTMTAEMEHTPGGPLALTVRFGRRGDDAELTSQRYSCKVRFDEVCEALNRSDIPYRITESGGVGPKIRSDHKPNAVQGADGKTSEDHQQTR
jgi:hypothetical protein